MDSPLLVLSIFRNRFAYKGSILALALAWFSRQKRKSGPCHCYPCPHGGLAMAQPYSLVQGGSWELAYSLVRVVPENWPSLKTILLRRGGCLQSTCVHFKGKKCQACVATALHKFQKKVLTTTGNNIPRGATQSVCLRNYSTSLCQRDKGGIWHNGCPKKCTNRAKS